MEPLCRIRNIFEALEKFSDEFRIKYGISLNEGMLLCSISRHDECTSGNIAELLGLTSSNASKVISSAEKKELIERNICKEDKRRMRFTLTDKGRSLLKKIESEPEGILSVIDTIKNI